LNIAGFVGISLVVLFIFRNKPFRNAYFDNELSRLFW
jgi:hypothetical protein